MRDPRLKKNRRICIANFSMVSSAFLKKHVVTKKVKQNKVRVPSKDLKKSIKALREMRRKFKLKNNPSSEKESDVAVVPAKKKKKMKIVLKKRPPKSVGTKTKVVVKKKPPIKAVKKKRKFFPSARVAPE